MSRAGTPLRAGALARALQACVTIALRVVRHSPVSNLFAVGPETMHLRGATPVPFVPSMEWDTDQEALLGNWSSPLWTLWVTPRGAPTASPVLLRSENSTRQHPLTPSAILRSLSPQSTAPTGVVVAWGAEETLDLNLLLSEETRFALTPSGDL